MARKNQDKYTNLASAEVTVDNATLNFTELLTGISLGQGTGIIIDQIDYAFSAAAIKDLDADGDGISFGWVTSDEVSSLDLDIRQVIHMARVTRIDGGTAGNMWLHHDPMIHQFFPPLIVAAPRIYLACNGFGNVSDGTVKSRVYFRYIDLTTQEYLELAEAFVLVG